jgi:hypothetical protein
MESAKNVEFDAIKANDAKRSYEFPLYDTKSKYGKHVH